MPLVVNRPLIFLVGASSLQPGLQQYLEHKGVAGWTTDATSDGEFLIETGGRVCYEAWYRRRPGGNGAYIRHLLEAGHGNPLEHSVYTFILCGVSRSLAIELVRHRVGMTPSMRSQRYVDEAEARFVEPPRISQNPALHEIWSQAVETCQDAYKALADALENVAFADVEDKTMRRKLAREAARSVLPNATETEIQWTANARAIRNFLELRASPHAEAEIRRVAVRLWEIVVEHSPSVFGDFERVTCPDGSQALSTAFRKV